VPDICREGKRILREYERMRELAPWHRHRREEPAPEQKHRTRRTKLNVHRYFLLGNIVEARPHRFLKGFLARNAYDVA
jgi:hypothetical protein